MNRMRLVLAGLVAMLSASSAHAAKTIHVVKSGDSLWSVAQRHGCSVDDLQRVNELEGETVYPGDKLHVPRCAGSAPRVDTRSIVVVKGDNLIRLAQRHRTTPEAIAKLNGLRSTTIRVGQTLRIPTRPPRWVLGQSVGRPQRGKLVDGVLLPHHPNYYRRRIERAWGARHVVDQLSRFVADVNAKHRGLPRVAIGDLSAKTGGKIFGHNSHQSGRDVDVGLFFRKRPQGYPQEFVSARKGELHIAANWTFVDTLAKAADKPGGPQVVFLDYDIQRKLYKHARKHGVSKRRLKSIFQYPDGRHARGRLVQHVRFHHDHYHVRFSCPPKDKTCR